MALAMTKVKVYGNESSEPLQKRFLQFLEMEITGANTDATYDFGTYAGTFWTAVGSTSPGSVALKAIKDIQVKAQTFLAAQSDYLAGRQQLPTSEAGVVTYLDSAVYAGGSATPTLTVTGLATADTILTAQQRIKTANSLPLLGWTDGSRTLNQLVVAYSADPGATGVVRVAVIKAAASTVSPLSGQYTLAMDATNTHLPDIAFASGDAPTSWTVLLSWELKDGEIPDEVTVSA